MIDPLTVQAALLGLQKRFPGDVVELWWKLSPSGQEKFTASVEPNRELDLPAVFGFGDSPEEAVSQLIKDCGQRDPESVRARRIAQLRDQLAKLEASQPKTL